MPPAYHHYGHTDSIGYIRPIVILMTWQCYHHYGHTDSIGHIRPIVIPMTWQCDILSTIYCGCIDDQYMHSIL